MVAIQENERNKLIDKVSKIIEDKSEKNNIDIFLPEGSVDSLIDDLMQKQTIHNFKIYRNKQRIPYKSITNLKTLRNIDISMDFPVVEDFINNIGYKITEEQEDSEYEKLVNSFITLIHNVVINIDTDAAKYFDSIKTDFKKYVLSDSSFYKGISKIIEQTTKMDKMLTGAEEILKNLTIKAISDPYAQKVWEDKLKEKLSSK